MSITLCFPSRVRTRFPAYSRAQSCANAHCANAHCARTPQGRLLVECLVAMLLLDATAMVVVGLARGVAESTQAANGTATALSVALLGVESSLATSCSSANASGTDALPLGSVTWTERANGRLHERDIQATLTSSALTGTRTTTLAWRTARLCP